MWANYSTRDAADFLGLPESAIRGCVQEGVVASKDGSTGLRLNFRDLLVLKKVKTLAHQGISMRRVRRQLGELRRRLPASSSLSELSLAAHEGHVIVRDSATAWRADSGQLVFDFILDEPDGQVQNIPLKRVAPPEPILPLSTSEWLERARELEEEDSEGAISAYKNALRMQPDCGDTYINLGRVFAETGSLRQASDCFKRALDLDPADSTALYNLGVVSQDAGKDENAIDFYLRALDIDPDLAEAHYNLATIFDRIGDGKAAIRHINEYRKLN